MQPNDNSLGQCVDPGSIAAAADILAAAGVRTVTPISVRQLGSQAGEAGFVAILWEDIKTGRVFYVSDMDEDTDGPGGSEEQDRYWQPETTLRYEGKSIDSRKVAGVVVPLWLPRKVRGIVMGCQARVTNLATNAIEPAVTYDGGPTTKSGEGSTLLCNRIGAPGGENRPLFLFEIFPGVPAVVDGVLYKLQPAGHS